EAWANLGYARLMRYCDSLDARDLRDFGVGPLVTGGFYNRPGWLEGRAGRLRGVNEKLWKDAVTAFEKALGLNPDLVLARANLGMAYLVCPDGRDVKKA